jgi:hypothetical protein
MLLCNRCGIHYMRYKKLPGAPLHAHALQQRACGPEPCPAPAAQAPSVMQLHLTLGLLWCM